MQYKHKLVAVCIGVLVFGAAAASTSFYHAGDDDSTYWSTVSDTYWYSHDRHDRVDRKDVTPVDRKQVDRKDVDRKQVDRKDGDRKDVDRKDVKPVDRKQVDRKDVDRKQVDRKEVERVEIDRKQVDREVVRPDEPVDAAQVRVAHMSPDAPDVNVYVDGEPAVEDLAYTDVTPYLELEPDTYQVTINDSDDTTTVFDDEVTVDAERYTVAAIGELADDSFAPEIFVDEPDELDPGESQLRVIHASPDAPAVDVTTDGDLLFGDVAFGEATDYEVVPTDTYPVEVRPADDGDGEVVYSADAVLDDGVTYTVFAAGYLDPEDAAADAQFELVAVEDDTVAAADADVHLTMDEQYRSAYQYTG